MQAFADGKPIPPEVAAQYPELQRAAARAGHKTPPVQPPGGGSSGGGPGGPRKPPAPPAGPAGPGGPGDLPDFAANIRLEKLDTSDAVKQVLVDTAKANDDHMPERRGVVSWRGTVELADQMGMDVSDLTSRTRGQAFNAHQIEAARRILLRTGEDVVRSGEAVRLNPTPDALAALAQSMARHASVQEQVAGFTAEAGRALNIFRKHAGDTDRARAIKSIVEKAGGKDKLIDVAEALATLDDPGQMSQFIRQAIPATRSQQLLEAWINGLLSGPRTHVTNLLSNTLTNAFNLVETGLAGAIGKLHGGDKVYMREASAHAFGTLEGVREGMVAFAKAMRTEGEGGFAFGKTELSRQQAIPGRLGKVVRIPGRLLSASDEFFKAVAYRQTINSRALGDGLARKLAGEDLARHVKKARDDPRAHRLLSGEDLGQVAETSAHKLTFTSQLGKIGQAAQQFSNAHPVMKVIVPFVRTPLNIVKFAVERTPAALLSSDVRAALKGGGRGRDMALARIGVGSAMGGLIAMKALEGKVTGGGPKDPGERAVLYESGWLPYAFNVGGSYYSFARLEPIATIFGLAADYAEISGSLDETTSNDLAGRIGLAISNNLANKTFLQGASAIIAGFSDPERYAGPWFEKLAGSMVPTISSQVATSIDPTIRDTRTVLDAWKERIPGQRQTLPPRVGILGENASYGDALGPDLLSPIYSRQANTDPVARELVRLKVGVEPMEKKLDGKLLPPREYEEIQRVAGRRAKQIIEDTMQSREWGSASDETKRKAVKQAFEEARDQARTRARMKYTTPEQIIQVETKKRYPNLQRLRELGVDHKLWLHDRNVQRQMRRRVNLLSGQAPKGKLSQQDLRELDMLATTEQ